MVLARFIRQADTGNFAFKTQIILFFSARENADNFFNKFAFDRIAASDSQTKKNFGKVIADANLPKNLLLLLFRNLPKER